MSSRAKFKKKRWTERQTLPVAGGYYLDMLWWGCHLWHDMGMTTRNSLLETTVVEAWVQQGCGRSFALGGCQGIFCIALSAYGQKWCLLMLNEVRAWRKIIKDAKTKWQQRSYLLCKILHVICVDKTPFVSLLFPLPPPPQIYHW